MKGLLKRFFLNRGVRAQARRKDRNRTRGSMVVSFDGRVVRLRTPDPL